MQKTCLKKCVEDVSRSILSPGEESCMYRCAIKYREALKFGLDMVKF